MAEDPVLLVRQERKKGDNRTGRGQDALLEQFNNLNEKTQVAQEQEEKCPSSIVCDWL